MPRVGNHDVEEAVVEKGATKVVEPLVLSLVLQCSSLLFIVTLLASGWTRLDVC